MTNDERLAVGKCKLLRAMNASALDLAAIVVENDRQVGWAVERRIRAVTCQPEPVIIELYISIIAQLGRMNYCWCCCYLHGSYTEATHSERKSAII